MFDFFSPFFPPRQACGKVVGALSSREQAGVQCRDWRRSVTRGSCNAQSAMVGRVMKRVETEFDDTEFLEGALDACYMGELPLPAPPCLPLLCRTCSWYVMSIV